MKRKTRALILCFVVIAGFAIWAGSGREVARAEDLTRHGALVELMAQSVPNEFTTDGCSGGMSAFYETFTGAGPGWEACCITHDRAYHNAAGAKTAQASFDARLDADHALRTCVQASSESKMRQFVGEMMFRAVRFGGKPCTDKPYRWGYGYPFCD